MQKTKKFKQVLHAGETAADNAPTVRVIGTLTEFKAGSRTKRYLVGFGAGKSKVTAHVKFLDAATGQVLFEQDVKGDVVMGVFGGDSGGMTRELAGAVTKTATKQLF
jgi:hypothetical protein